MANLGEIVKELQEKRDEAANTIQRIDAALAALNNGSSAGASGTRSRLSEAAKARIAAAQRARWARLRANGGKKHNLVSMPQKRTVSVAARRKIAAAQKLRWAKVKAAQKKSA